MRGGAILVSDVPFWSRQTTYFNVHRGGWLDLGSLQNMKKGLVSP